MWCISNMSPCLPVDDCRTGGGPCRNACVGGAGGGLTAVGEPAESRQDGGTSVPGAQRLRDSQTQPGRGHSRCYIWRGSRSKGVCVFVCLHMCVCGYVYLICVWGCDVIAAPFSKPTISHFTFLVAAELILIAHLLDAWGKQEKLTNMCVHLYIRVCVSPCVCVCVCLCLCVSLCVCVRECLLTTLFDQC